MTMTTAKMYHNVIALCHFTWRAER